MSAAADHPVEISRDQWLRVSWRCDTCQWVGHDIGSEMTARAEHARIAADIASGRLPAGPATIQTTELDSIPGEPLPDAVGSEEQASA